MMGLLIRVPTRTCEWPRSQDQTVPMAWSKFFPMARFVAFAKDTWDACFRLAIGLSLAVLLPPYLVRDSSWFVVQRAEMM